MIVECFLNVEATPTKNSVVIDIESKLLWKKKTLMLYLRLERLDAKRD